MVNRIQNQYAPDYVSPPGETLLETLETLGMSQADLAERTGKAIKTINEIVQGKAPITPETALQFERVLGVPARFWNNREQRYRESLAQAGERERLQAHVGWLKQAPVKAMCQLGWIRCLADEIEQLREVLQFFGVASPDQWQAIWLSPQASFRCSPAFEADPVAVAAWLRRGEFEAQRLPCEAYDVARFRAALTEVRQLTQQPPEVFQAELIRLCATAGVAVVFVPELPKVHVSGATRWLTPTKALIQLSLRHKSDDHLWFTFFHEAGHILHHGKREFFIDIDDRDGDDKEQAADKFAADCLIPAPQWRRFARQTRYSKEQILAFAAEAGVAPGIVVGRLQHDKLLPPSHCNDLKRRLDWASDAAAVVART